MSSSPDQRDVSELMSAQRSLTGIQSGAVTFSSVGKNQDSDEDGDPVVLWHASDQKLCSCAGLR
jgi:hypothetical protein